MNIVDYQFSDIAGALELYDFATNNLRNRRTELLQNASEELILYNISLNPFGYLLYAIACAENQSTIGYEGIDGVERDAEIEIIDKHLLGWGSIVGHTDPLDSDDRYYGEMVYAVRFFHPCKTKKSQLNSHYNSFELVSGIDVIEDWNARIDYDIDRGLEFFGMKVLDAFKKHQVGILNKFIQMYTPNIDENDLPREFIENVLSKSCWEVV